MMDTMHSFSWLISTISRSTLGYIILVSTGNTQIYLVHGWDALVN